MTAINIDPNKLISILVAGLNSGAIDGSWLKNQVAGGIQAKPSYPLGAIRAKSNEIRERRKLELLQKSQNLGDDIGQLEREKKELYQALEAHRARLAAEQKAVDNLVGQIDSVDDQLENKHLLRDRVYAEWIDGGYGKEA